MTFIPSNRRRFLQASLAAAGALGTGLGVRSSRGDEPGVDAGPFATENPTIRQARRVALEVLKPSASRPGARAGAPRRQPRLRVVRLRPASRPRRRGLRQGDRGGRLGRGADRPPRRDVDDALRDRRGRAPRVPRRLPRLGRDRHLPEHRRGGERPPAAAEAAGAVHLHDRPAPRPARQGGPPRRRGRREEGGHALPGLHHQRGAAHPALGERARRAAGRAPVPPARGADDAPDLQPPQPPGRRGGRAERRRAQRLRPPGDRRDEPAGGDRRRRPLGLAHQPRGGQGLEPADGRQPHHLRGAVQALPRQARRDGAAPSATPGA